jgi:hypothetical protein
MSEVSKILRRTETGYVHWCAACESGHFVQVHGGVTRWGFNGDVERPTFTPSVKITYSGPDAGVDDAPPACCHYFITDGRIAYCPDSTHDLAGQTVDLTEIPADYCT